MSLAALAAQLGMAGQNPSRTLQRFETGEREIRAELAARIVALTEGAVTLQDLHQPRLDWLQATAPDVPPRQSHVERSEAQDLRAPASAGDPQ